MTTTVRQLLRDKPDVFALPRGATVLDALELMARHNIGAVLIMDGQQIAGILSERDYARKGILKGRVSRDTGVAEIMSSPVVTIDPAWTAAQCMALMTDKRIRHLPVVEEGRVVGVISIGDVVRAIVDEQQFTIRALEHYIAS